MKKIQLGTVHKEADVQVIYLDSSFITKAVKAKINAEMACEEMLSQSDERKFFKEIRLCPNSARQIVYEVLPFLCELVSALEGENEQ